MPDPIIYGTLPLDPPNIKVIFRGFVITEITPGEPEAMVGALRDSVCHRPIVHIYQINADDSTEIVNFPVDINQAFSLRVDNASLPIQVFHKDRQDFNRLDEAGNDKKDFRWFVNLDEIHTIPIIVEEAQLHPQFTLNRGLFHSSKLSDGEVRIEKQEPYPGTVQRFGRFSLEITARVFLTASETAVFQNGTNFRVIRGDGPRYEILFDCTCRSADETTSDFDLVYHALANPNHTPIDSPKRVKLESIPPALTQEEAGALTAQVRSLLVINPEVYCTGGNHG